eukprot:1480409-Prymnesium_polylepis.1
MEEAFAEGPQNEFQVGCPFALKEIVHVKSRGDGRVIGLPYADEELNEEFAADVGDIRGRVWVHLETGDRVWIAWDACRTVRRSPNKRPPSSTDKQPKASRQTLLFHGQSRA